MLQVECYLVDGKDPCSGTLSQGDCFSQVVTMTVGNQDGVHLFDKLVRLAGALGLSNQGSITITFPLGETNWNAECPNQVTATGLGPRLLRTEGVFFDGCVMVDFLPL